MIDMFNVPFSLLNMGPVGETEPTHTPYRDLNAEALRKELQAFMSYSGVSADSRQLLSELRNRLFAKQAPVTAYNGEPVTSLDLLIPNVNRGIHVHFIERDFTNNQLHVYFSSSVATPHRIVVQTFDNKFCPVGREAVDGVVPPPREVTPEELGAIMVEAVKKAMDHFDQPFPAPQVPLGFEVDVKDAEWTTTLDLSELSLAKHFYIRLRDSLIKAFTPAEADKIEEDFKKKYNATGILAFGEKRDHLWVMYVFKDGTLYWRWEPKPASN